MREIVVKAKEFAIKYHHPLQNYDEADYSFHLQQTVDLIESICDKHANEVHESIKYSLMAGGWLHDILEDSFINYNDIKKKFGFMVAEIAYGCMSDVKNRTRKERFSERFYSELRKIPYAFFVKACDRLANMRYSKASGSSMYETYKAELADFLEKGNPSVGYLNAQEKLLNEEVIKLLLEV